MVRMDVNVSDAGRERMERRKDGRNRRRSPNLAGAEIDGRIPALWPSPSAPSSHRAHLQRVLSIRAQCACDDVVAAHYDLDSFALYRRLPLPPWRCPP